MAVLKIDPLCRIDCHNSGVAIVAVAFARIGRVKGVVKRWQAIGDRCGLFDLERAALDHYDSVQGAPKAAAVSDPLGARMSGKSAR
jgi:hypothetical protein